MKGAAHQNEMDSEMEHICFTHEISSHHLSPVPFEPRPDLLQTLIRHAAQRPLATALISRQSEMTYADLVRFLVDAGEAFAKSGVTPQHRVALLVPPALEGALLILAIACHAQLVPLNPSLTDSELAREVTRIGCDLLLAKGSRVALADVVTLGHCAVLDQRLKLTLEPDTSLPRLGNDVTPFKIAFLLRSSGTTGEPKQIAVTHENLRAMAEKVSRWFDLTEHDRIPCLLPLYYAAGLKTSLFVPLLIGANVGLPDGEEAYHLQAWFDAIRPTILSLAPTSIRALVDRLPDAEPHHFPGLRFAISGAAYLPDALRRAAEARLGVPVLEYYGLSEAGAMAANPAPPHLRKPGTVGLLLPEEVELRDEDGARVHQGDVGEIWLRGPSLTPGYVSATQRTPFGLESGWLPTGDLGCLDEQGYLTIVGRKKELINRGGEKVSPYEVEKALLQHPAVAEAAVFAIPHLRLGENVAASVVLKPECAVDEDDLRQFLCGSLAPFKIPRHIQMMERIPRGPTGKILRADLAREYLEQPQAIKRRPDRMLEHQIAAVWEQFLNRSDLGIDDDFFDLGGDSLLAVDMLAAVEKLAHKPLKQSQLTARLTIRRLTDAICADQDGTRELITCMRQGKGTPVFFCHGDYTTRGLFSLRLFELAETDQPVYLLHFYQDLHRPDLTIEQIVASYLPEIRKVHPQGPLTVGGYCNGGLVAWELTRQLEKARYHVKGLLLVETPSLNARPSFRFLHAMTQILGSLLPGRIGRVISQESMRALWHRMRGHDTFRSLLHHAWQRLLRKLHASASGSGGADETSPHWLYQRTLARYKPGRIQTQVFCFIAREGRLMDTDAQYWKKWAKKVFCFEMDGTHHSIVTAEVASLARDIQCVLVLLK